MTDVRVAKSDIKPKVTVLGIGGAGVKIIKYLTSVQPSGWLTLAAADADMNSLNEVNFENVFPVGIEWTLGLGCGGNRDRGVSAFGHRESKKKLGDFISGSSMLIVTGGLGGGAGTGGAEVVSNLAISHHDKNVTLVTFLVIDPVDIGWVGDVVLSTFISSSGSYNKQLYLGKQTVDKIYIPLV